MARATARGLSSLRRMAAYLTDLAGRIEQLDRRLNNIEREAKVIAVNAEKGLVKVRAHGLESAWVPWAEDGGEGRSWRPPAEGERVVLVSPTGEPGQGYVRTGGFSNQYQRPSERADERLLLWGEDVRIRQRADLVEVTRGEQVVELEADPPRMRVHFGGKSLAIIRERRAQLKVRPNEQGAAPVHLTVDLERMIISSSIPLIVEEDPYPED